MVLASFNAAEVLIHQLFPDVFSNWLASLNDLVSVVAQFIPAIDHVSSEMEAAGYGYRVPFLRHLIAMNWLIDLSVILLLVPTIVCECHRRGARKWADIAMGVVASGRTIGGIWGGALIGLGFMVGFAATRFGFGKPLALYYSDAEIMVICIVFAVLLSAVSQFVSLTTFLFMTRCSDVSELRRRYLSETSDNHVNPRNP